MKYNLENTENKVFSVIVAFSPLLSIYSAGIPGISIIDAALMCFLIYIIIVKRDFSNISLSFKWLLIFVIYLLISLCLNLIFQTPINAVSVINRLIKFGLFMIVIIYLFPNYLNKNILYKSLKNLALIASLAIYLQYIFYYIAGVYIQFKIPFLSYANEIVDNVNYAEVQMSSFRPSSIFLEPAHFSVFSILTLSLILFSHESKKKDIYLALFISLSLLLSLSTTATLLLVIVWSWYMLISVRNFKSFLTPVYIIIMCLVVFFIIIPIYMNTPQLFQTVDRVMDPNSIAVTGRINAGETLVNSIEGLNIWIGLGFGNFDSYIYMNSINYLIYCTGYLGIVIFFSVLLKIFLATGRLGKVVIVIFSMLCFSSPIVISVNIIPYFALIFLSYTERFQIKNNERGSKIEKNNSTISPTVSRV